MLLSVFHVWVFKTSYNKTTALRIHLLLYLEIMHCAVCLRMHAIFIYSISKISAAYLHLNKKHPKGSGNQNIPCKKSKLVFKVEILNE